MKKLKKMIAALALSVSLLLTGCTISINVPATPNATDEQKNTQAEQGTQGTQAGQDAQGTQAGQPVQGTQAGQPAQDTTPANETVNVPQSSSKTATMDLNGNSITVTNAVYCLTDNGDMVIITGETNGAYFLLTFASTTGIQANTSYSQKDFGSTMELGVVVVEPSAGIVIVDHTQEGVTGASFSVKDISDSDMDVTMSAAMNAYNADFSFNASGIVTLTDLDTCTKIISEFDALAASAQSVANSNKQPVTCAVCNGSKKCNICRGDRKCHACLGLLDHCISCGGSNVCKYCSGSGKCRYCNGTGVIN